LRINRQRVKAGVAAASVLAVLACTPGAASANCGGGGVSAAETDVCTPTAKARLLTNGMLVPPKSAPPRVKAVIAAANKIRTKPYIYGGGHARWQDRGYDCSGSVSYALHGGRFLESPLPSGPMESWGLAGEGRWITVYANAGHAYAVIAGYRWDTSGDAAGTGPRWHEDLRDNVGYVARHPAGY
jgi:cell wall-associated NlpC family hydrolase